VGENRELKEMTPTGFEPDSTIASRDYELGNPPSARAAQSGAVSGGIPWNLGLSRLALASHVKAAILALAFGADQPPRQ
jgi:hypothetical protein